MKDRELLYWRDIAASEIFESLVGFDHQQQELFTWNILYINKNGEYESLEICNTPITAMQLLERLLESEIKVKFVERGDGSIDMVDTRCILRWWEIIISYEILKEKYKKIENRWTSGRLNRLIQYTRDFLGRLKI